MISIWSHAYLVVDFVLDSLSSAYWTYVTYARCVYLAHKLGDMV